MDLVHRRSLEPDREGHLTALDPAARAWLEATGFAITDESLWVEALTHGSTGSARDYQRLEFLGDRVLGLAVAEWLHATHEGAEGELAQRLNALVSRQMCARIARAIGAPAHLLLGKQARDDGANDSDNILGDVTEALLGASFIENGWEPTRALIRRLWADAMRSPAGASKHPKSALQEWAAGNRRRPPVYEITDRSGPDHAQRFTVRVSVHNVGQVEATASSKQDAETAAARAFMQQFG